MVTSTPARRVLLAIAAALAALLVAFVGVALLAVPIKGTSMEPTLHEGDRVVVNPFDRSPDVRRFSIVIGRFSRNGAEVVKRVIGLPGDRVRIEKIGVRPGIVSVQPGGTGPWQVVDNPAWHDRWGQSASNCCTDAGKLTNVATPQVVPPGMVFLLGDNFASSDDSRAHGFAPLELIRATTSWRIYPLGAIGRLSDDVTLTPVP
ncbi:signal peptidase I [Antrihabitans sp. YC2-6]|uniref:signal peptidase I n=1 Tax=Antrihabitans sp. YC2-6 TaxID=2799498 RepID=UPI0018F457FB|nr:signal peptidase I [Antrihabitans sp. YC2-6]MBJ8344041.1 signal peptidase I [Antrihabitans sp. YC2-6]